MSPVAVEHPVAVVGEVQRRLGAAGPADVVVEPGQRLPALEDSAGCRRSSSPGCGVGVAVAPRLPDQRDRRALPLERGVRGDRLLQVEQGVGLALADERRHPDVAHVAGDGVGAQEVDRRLARVALACRPRAAPVQTGGVEVGAVRRARTAASAAGSSGDGEVLGAVGDAERREQRRPLVLEDAGLRRSSPSRCARCPPGRRAVLRGQGVGEVVPGDQRDDRVQPVGARGAARTPAAANWIWPP